MSEDIRLYTGLSETKWSGLPVEPGPYACISPINGRTEKSRSETYVSIPLQTQVLQDSGAFSDSWVQRLTFAGALDRQTRHAKKYGYEDRLLYRATYDLLIDEVWDQGNRSKRRWSVEMAESAVAETIQAAHWLNQHREGYPLVLSAQGVDAPQYLRCLKDIVQYYRSGDLIGLGGWCIIGKMCAQMMPIFAETVDLIMPFLATENIPTVHIWGVIFPPALGYLYLIAHQYGIKVSTDSTGVSLNPVRGNWGYGSWRDNRYQRPNGIALGRDRIRHVTLCRDWLSHFAASVDMDRVTFSRPQPECVTEGLENVTLPRCVICGEIIIKRQHAKTCGPCCRKRLSRLEIKETSDGK